MLIRSRIGVLYILALASIACVSAQPAAAQTPLTTERVVSGIAKPTFVAAPPGDSSRIFITELDSGRIRIVKNGALLPAPFLTVRGVSTGNERGLLGLAFHPSYSTNGYFYVAYTDTTGGSQIRRYTVSADPDIADSTSAATIMSFVYPQLNHLGGWIGFGPNDGYLYIAKGDATMPDEAQTDFTPWGKVLRVDVDSAFPYAVPPSNPYPGAPMPKRLFWCRGLRNPWRCSFDRGTGDLYIGDVGEGDFEEIDYQPAASAGAENYGWPLFEGYSIFDCPDPCDSTGLTRPVHAIAHSPIPPFFCSVTGGYVYRGDAIPDLQGTYFYADFCSGQIWSFRVDGGVATELTERTLELTPSGGQSIDLVVSFGEDASGELYICDYLGGEVYKIVADPTGVGASGAGEHAAARIDGLAPNPSAAGIRFRVRLERGGPARLDVYDAGGRRLRTLLEGSLAAGSHALEWDGRDSRGARVAPGIYLLRLDAGSATSAEKISIVR